MSRARIVQQAQDEIATITDYITLQNPGAAERFVNRLFDLLETLATQPLMGEQRPDLSEGLRSCSFGNYVIYFRPMNDGIRVLHLIHGARDVSVVDFDMGDIDGPRLWRGKDRQALRDIFCCFVQGKLNTRTPRFAGS